MKEKQNSPSRGGARKILAASLFILAGVLLSARNMGFITDEWFKLLVAWHSLFIIIGVYTMIRQRYFFGSVLLLTGVYLLGGELMLFPGNTQAMIWPLVLVLTGFFILNTHRKRNWEKRRMRFYRKMTQRMSHEPMGGREEQRYQSEDGFLYSNNVFGTVRHVVLDELFKGANIRASFGGSIIDLRHTHIAPGETYIDLDCNWGGVELYVPGDWKVRIECNCFCGGCEDKRWSRTKQESCILVIRGSVSFGGIEIKE